MIFWEKAVPLSIEMENQRIRASLYLRLIISNQTKIRWNKLVLNFHA